MKKYDEVVLKIPSHYIQGYYMQIMLAYRHYLLLYGNKDLLYFKNLKDKNPSIIGGYLNDYLNDSRKKDFPYSSIPEHTERLPLLGKRIFTNQILDFEKPYIKVNDGFISKITAYKDGNEAIIHTNILNGKSYNPRTKIITREEIENYLKTGTLEQVDDEEFKVVSIFNMDGKIYNSGLESEQVWIDREKDRLTNIIDYGSYFGGATLLEIKNAISKLDDIAPFNITEKLMIKFKANGEIKIDWFALRYLRRDLYQIDVVNLPVTMHSLSMIKTELPVIKYVREPRISLSLNPNITMEQLQEEKSKILAKKYF